MKRIVFTGGGTAGHVTPNLAIIKEIQNEDNYQIDYIGSKNGIEKELIEKIGIPYHPISSGKLRRYIDFENVKDIFRVLKGCLDARRTLKKLKPQLVFSKGGFVSVPVIIAASTLKIPIFIHESDFTPGLANKISQRFATKIFTSFEETKRYLPGNKTESIGSPIRKDILTGSAEKARKWLGFHSQLPVLLIMGGSLGARKINETVRSYIDELTKNYQIVHLCGKNNLDPELENQVGYKQFEYVHEELADILALADIVITRGGSNAIFEFVALEIPMIIIPLGKDQSRGDQIINAKSFQEKGYALMLEEKDLTKNSLFDYLDKLSNEEDEIKTAMRNGNQGKALDHIINEIKAI
ncbi:undecaprenyldiphospho-muramoylpentapeptide beta-N-acetylglucosaminyltransferase [Alkalihalobacillus trypoxylicola]|uniref:UDP-N-acetylglucosamine--N-acetylmuramyl-(pentapeptide) pyrophosphoryl-undecaprenol N-acetylglucosamine transferase n=1 Tax=Alkalihalobacillus trypoxylicola TaxID=519424 RepID=A0A161PG25_9BACI|nr:undecaprenyldiphospho-muramoylpentapeptide beta-N-acetylglucosaminyltransferase [Alkalihalobacillus trypoxylicola]KYG27642.1 UDP-N-acetylglucosamine--N-acetylmuramyl-(pentapeptide) pyrophosphoryl-undecaprenol N-acetylglucosamine transferase [Alkalihalobacillus trypoxylicola]